MESTPQAATTAMTTTQDESPKTHILVLSTFTSCNVPLVINAAANDYNNIDFSVREDVDVYQSCALTWQNEHFVFGGKNKHNQIAKIIGCRLEPLNIELPFDYINGACVTVDNDQRPDKQVYLCFSVDELNTEGPESKKCRVAASPHDETWTEIDDSYAKHQHIRISTNNGR